MKFSSITFIILVSLLLNTTEVFSQSKKSQPPVAPPTPSVDTPTSFKDIRLGNATPRNESSSPLREIQLQRQLFKPLHDQPNIKIKRDDRTGLPIWITGAEKDAANLRSATDEVRCISYLEAIKEPLRIENPAEEFVMKKMETDDLGQKHILMQQVFQGIKVYGSELKMHEKNGEIFLVHGRHFPTPNLETISPTINTRNAEEVVKTTVANFKTIPADHKKFIAGEQLQSELVIYHQNENHREATLAYHITIIPNLVERWEYFVDAATGEVLHKYESLCKLHTHLGNHSHDENTLKKHSSDHDELLKLEHNSKFHSNMLNGPATANATDLFGVNRTINTYEIGGNYFLYDGSKSMFDVNSDLPSDPVGMIVTVDGLNTYPGNSSFDYQVLTSSNNTWSNPNSVSAHYNGGEAYEYFKTVHQRESINGQGGNIISFINISDKDGNDFDNAFWNGAAMFYGNGNQAFTSPLAKALDVAGHEMSHGVIQNTANLEYQGQAGAMNESFADIFGAMIDRDDWHLGEDITNSNYIPTGHLRSLSDPHNGGSSLNTPGWQPRTMSEYQNLANTPEQDYGGVHINSGIVNYAYYLFASDIGKDKAEQIYYRALTQYLVKSSQFVDLRNAVVQSATDLYGANEVNAANGAFDAVGIAPGSGGNYQTDVSVNDGTSFVLHSDADLGALYISELSGMLNPSPNLSDSDPISRPSITDDGSIIVFVDSENNLKFINIDWMTGAVNEDYIEPETSRQAVWANVVISKDGNRIAMNKILLENKIYVFDFNLGGTLQEYELYNPTTSDPNTGGAVTTGEVQYADFMEFDFTGEFLMYDAYNKIEGNFGNNLEYWDIGFINIFNNANNTYASGNIEKLFTGIPENVSIANPTFAKNSPYIVAFDYREEGFFSNSYRVLGANIQTGDTDLLVENEAWSFPNYSVNDDKLIYDMPYENTTVLGVINVNGDKISGDASSSTFLFPNGTVAEKWGVWFATGQRELVGTNDVLLEELQFKAYPNPTNESITIELQSEQNENTLVSVYDLMGKKVKEQNINIHTGKNVTTLSMKDLSNGAYFLVFNMEKGNVTLKVMKN